LLAAFRVMPYQVLVRFGLWDEMLAEPAPPDRFLLGHAKEAETVYWEDLRRNPENGWSLFGLARTLRAQGREADAALIDARFKKAWTNADVTLPGSRF